MTKSVLEMQLLGVHVDDYTSILEMQLLGESSFDWKLFIVSTVSKT